MLELGLEEIPARFMQGLQDDLKAQFKKQLDQAGLSSGELQTCGTYRRLTLFVTDLVSDKPEVRKIAKGPKLAQAKDAQGHWTPAALGFAKKNGVDATQLSEQDGCVAANVVRPAQATIQLLPTLIVNAVKAMHLPLAMHWNTHEGPFVRPLHWLVALYGSQLVDVSLFGIKAGRVTRGHRFLSTGESSVTSADFAAYLKLLAGVHVHAQAAVRKQVILEKIAEQASKLQATPVYHDALIAELSYIVEDPNILVGSFDESFTEVPKEILILTMQKNQKYIPLEKNGKLLNQFLVLYEGQASAEANIRSGNEKVIRARLSDAKFFVEEDKKKSLDVMLESLGRSKFIEGLGTIGQKNARMLHLALSLAKALNQKGVNLTLFQVDRVAKYAKADLGSQAVFEFPELQGIMGRYYFAHQFSDASAVEVSAIEEHWWPKGAGGALPSSDLAAVVAVADKLDTLLGCFLIGKIPTGSADPFALRRAAQAVVDILHERGYLLSMKGVLGLAFVSLEDIQPELGAQARAAMQQFCDYVLQRVHFRVKQLGVDGDIADAVLGLAFARPVLRTVEAAQALQAARSQVAFKSIVQTAIRVKRLGSEAAASGTVDPALLKDAAEKNLWNALQKIQPQVDAALARSEAGSAVQALLQLAEPVEGFFKDVLVMHEDAALRANRLALLGELNALFAKIADFEKIVLASNI